MKLFLKNLLFTLVVPGSVGVLVPLLIAGGGARATGTALVAAVLLLGTGAAIYAWCVWDFASFGRGTPAPIDAPRRLVVRGLYRFTRNPMYVGVLTVILGWAVLLQSAVVALYALGVWLLFNAFVRLYEEPHLEREFGSEYATYRSQVRRWLPRLAPRREA